MNILPEELEYYIISEYLGERDSLSRLKCVSKKFDYISYHKTNHVECRGCGWFIKDFQRDHKCNVSNCMLIKNISDNINIGWHSLECGIEGLATGHGGQIL